MIDCVLIVVSYRSGPEVAGLLDTVEGSVGELSWRAIVVNNDPTEDLAFAVADHPQVEIVEAGSNVGYAGGINLGMAAAPPSRWTLFLNPDVHLGPGAIAKMAREADLQRAAVPTLVDDLGIVQRSIRREPTIVGSLGDTILGSKWATRPSFLSEVVRADRCDAGPREVDWATGAVLLVPTAVTEAVGRWDAERFFLYSEETDYCRRLRAAGCPIIFVPEAVVTHSGAGSGSSDALHALQEINRVRYFRKWHGPVAGTVFAGTAVLNNVLRCHRSGSRAALRALLSPTARARLPGGAR